jgi:hypothetical protein
MPLSATGYHPISWLWKRSKGYSFWYHERTNGFAGESDPRDPLSLDMSDFVMNCVVTRMLTYSCSLSAGI